ncbi:MAG: 50S ribosome-binding GTPase [Candidatus Peribacteria bacterium]|nr:MAG: 50S ribosome-binding GTPase [Candidatus Peribacteria bacterium]
MHFATSTNQYPEYALLGEPGRTRSVVLELQLLADVALIGTPSVGKSTLINASSNAKAKVAAYHFTTLVPNLGMVTKHGQDFSMIDIPGLIEGAADGKGLGNAFLRHILKAHIRNFVHDLSQYET